MDRLRTKKFKVVIAWSVGVILFLATYFLFNYHFFGNLLYVAETQVTFYPCYQIGSLVSSPLIETLRYFYVGDQKIVWTDIHYHSDNEEVVDLKSPDVVNKIREKHPDFSPAAFLNGTHKADDYKWLLTERIGNKDKIFGYTGKKFMELVMTVYHYM